MRRMDWMIYGATGYTGRLIAKEAVRRGLKPVLGGRNADALEEMGAELKLPYRVLSLDNPDTLHHGLHALGLVLHCAGPFSQTCKPMLEACLDVGCHYLDITGEIDVFAHCHAQHDRAMKRGIVVLPGSGFDVVPTDCLAAQLKARMPDARRLVLAFEAGGGPSRGTALTSVEGLGKGGRIRRNGQLQTVPLGWRSRSFERDGEQRTAVTIPWGDVYTAYVSTGIPDIEVYMAVPPSTVKRLRWLRWFRPFLGLGPIQSWLKAKVRKQGAGPSEKKREKTRTHVWGEVYGSDDEMIRQRLETPNGYELTVTASLGLVEHLLANRVAGGYYTPSQLMGSDYINRLPGVTAFDS